MFCPKCGNEIKDNDMFCEKCGYNLPVSISVDETETTVSQNQAPPVSQQTSSSAAAKSINVIGVCASIAYALGAFLPFASASAFGFSKSVSLMDNGTDWIIVMLFAIIGLGLSWLNKNIGVLLTGLLASGLAFLESTGFSSSSSSILSKGIGFYLLVIGAVGMIIAGVIGISKKQRDKK